MNSYDVTVIGAGPGGYVCAIRAAQLGLKTAIIDRQWLGGVCLNVGCIPTKSLLKNAEIAHLLRERGKDFGFSFENLVLDYSAAIKRSRQVSDRLTRGVGFLMKKNHIDVYMGEAKLVSPNEICATGSDGVESRIESTNIVIATGAHAGGIPGIDLDPERILTYQEAVLQTQLPKSIIIIGAGALGVEFATIWNAYGSQVTLVEMMDRILPMEDEEISLELARAFKKRGIQAYTSTKVLAVNRHNYGVTVKVASPEGEISLEADQALISIGFKPNSVKLGLEEAGVKVSPRGFIDVDERMATNVPGIWAIGDVTGKFLLAHVASAQGIHCAESIAGMHPEPIDYVMIPRATFSQPQVASLGFTETQAKEKGYDVRIGKFPFQPNGKALGMGENAGFCKIVADEKTGKLLGAHLIGPEVSEILAELTLAQRKNLKVEDISRTIHIHPTLSEVVMEAAESIEGASIHL